MKAANAAASLVLAIFLSLTAALGIAAAGSATLPSLMSPADYDTALRTVRYDARVALAGCRSLVEPQERAVCRAQARATERIAVANLEARYRGTVWAAEQVRAVEERTEHSLAAARRLAPT
jgi:hypothetical protein